MSEEAAKVTVLCTNKALAARIRGADPKRPLCMETPDPNKAIYEYAPALYVHVPEVVDYETRRRSEPPSIGAASEHQDSEVALHEDLEAHGPATPEFGGVPHNLDAAVLEGHILAVAFAEKFVIDADARRKQREVDGFVEQLSCLEYWMERHERGLVMLRGAPIPPPGPFSGRLYGDLLPSLGNSFVHQAYEAAKPWVRYYNLNSPPPDCPRNQDFDANRARAEFEKLRVWFEGTTGWIQAASIFGNLLPFPHRGIRDSGFVFVPQVPPDRKPQAASPAVAWVTGLLPFFVPELAVRVEPRPAGREPPPPVAQGPTAPGGAALARIRARLLRQGPSAEKATARLYDKVSGTVYPDEVRIEPLVVNPIRQALGIAVRIRKGAVLVLPECRDEEAKARLVNLLATELWEPIQEWCEPRPKAASVPAAGPVRCGAKQCAVFAKGRVYTAWCEIEAFLKAASDHVWLEDPYINGDVVTLLACVPEELPVRVLTRKLQDQANPALRKLGQQRPGRLEVKTTGQIHSRRIFVDKRVWETGESLKDLAAKTASTVNEITSPEGVATLRDDFESRWQATNRCYCNDKGEEAHA